jgi:hypothetical protein
MDEQPASDGQTIPARWADQVRTGGVQKPGVHTRKLAGKPALDGFNNLLVRHAGLDFFTDSTQARRAGHHKAAGFGAT